MCRSAGRLKETTSNKLKPEVGNTEDELTIALVKNILKTKITVLKSDKTKNPQHTSLDVLLLIDEFKNRFEKLGEKAREIAQKDGRNFVTYDDAEEALKLIRAKNKCVERLDQI